MSDPPSPISTSTPPNPAPDALISAPASLAYWNSVSSDVTGMLGGYPQISRIDLRGSMSFLRKLQRTSGFDSSQGLLSLAVDCGAGIGRVTQGFLLQAAEVVDAVEPVEKFAEEWRRAVGVRVGAEKGAGNEGPRGRQGEIYVTGLETWTPAAGKKYDLIWNQWCLGHLSDTQLVEYLRRCSGALTGAGWVVVKENLSTHRFGEDIFDEEDSSVTRSDGKFREIFENAEMVVVRAELQTGFPKGLGLFPVKMYALRPR